MKSFEAASVLSSFEVCEASFASRKRLLLMDQFQVPLYSVPPMSCGVTA